MAATNGEPIRFNCWRPEETGRLTLKFNLGAFSHPAYGSSAGNLCGEYELFNTAGTYRISNYFELSAAEQRSILEDTKVRLRGYAETLDEDDYVHLCNESILSAAACFPRLDARTPKFEMGIDGIPFAFLSEDSFEPEFLEDVPLIYRKVYEEPGKPKYAKYRNQHWTTYLNRREAEVYEDKSRYIAEVVESMPEVETVLKAMESIGNKAKAQLPQGLPKSIKFVVGAIFHKGEQVILTNQKAGGEFSLSDKRMKNVRASNSALEVLLEMYLLVQEISVPVRIRTTLVFQMLVTCVKEFGVLSDEILGIQRDAKDDEFDKNSILRRVRKGVSVDQSFTKGLKALHDIISDMRKIMNILMKSYPDEQGVAQFVQSVKDFCDGLSIGVVLFAERKLKLQGDAKIGIFPVSNTDTE